MGGAAGGSPGTGLDVGDAEVAPPAVTSAGVAPWLVACDTSHPPQQTVGTEDGDNSCPPAQGWKHLQELEVG